MPNVFQAFRDMEQTARMLSEDVIASYNLVEQISLPFAMRVYIRSVFTFIEGNTNAIQNLLLVANEQGSYALSEEDRIALSEINVTIDSRGKASSRKAFVSVGAKFRFVFRLYASMVREPVEIKVSGAGWQSFQKAIGIRNRITHPKSMEEFSVSEEDMVVVKTAFNWYATEIMRMNGAFIVPDSP